QQAAQAQRRQARRWAPVIAVFAVALVGIAVYQGFRLAHLEAAGMRAEGQVVRLKEEWRSGSGGSRYTYYPIVKFRTPDNATVEFKDSIGSNPPSHRPGDRVTVLYLADNPRADAMIDRGRFWNWAIPGLLLAGAALVGAIFVYLMRGGGAQAA
ncbi:MAG TPA: DUF3592 domain-containing protein, partial [Stellaceae bacterium]|nr:DUF3592 domain-containing protein [Stellaceae bacterium]